MLARAFSVVREKLACSMCLARSYSFEISHPLTPLTNSTVTLTGAA